MKCKVKCLYIYEIGQRADSFKFHAGMVTDLI